MLGVVSRQAKGELVLRLVSQGILPFLPVGRGDGGRPRNPNRGRVGVRRTRVGRGSVRASAKRLGTGLNWSTRSEWRISSAAELASFSFGATQCMAWTHRKAGFHRGNAKPLPQLLQLRVPAVFISMFLDVRFDSALVVALANLADAAMRFPRDPDWVATASVTTPRLVGGASAVPASASSSISSRPPRGWPYRRD